MATLLIGNGINNISNNISWNDLLKNLVNSINKQDVINLENKPFLHIYEEIYTRAKKYVSTDETTLKNRIVEHMKQINRNEYHQKILDLEFTNILTTNYDYCFSPEVTGTRTKETKYSLYRYQESNNTKIWHIHGELNNSESIMIGYEHYMGSIHNIQANQNKKKDRQKESWVDIFLHDNIYILGLGLDFGEIDLWWILSYRNRLILDKKILEKKIIYIKSKKINTLNLNEERILSHKEKEEQAKIEMLKVFGVEIKEINFNNSYEKFYDNVILFFKENINLNNYR